KAGRIEAVGTAEALATRTVCAHGKDEIAADAVIEAAQEDQPSPGQLLLQPVVNLLRLTPQPVVVHDDDRAAELFDVRGELAVPLFLKTELTQMPVLRRL